MSLDPAHQPAPFARIGRPPPRGAGGASRGLILLIAVGILAAFLALLHDLQVARQRPIIVEISFIGEPEDYRPPENDAPASPAPPPAAR